MIAFVVSKPAVWARVESPALDPQQCPAGLLGGSRIDLCRRPRGHSGEHEAGPQVVRRDGGGS